MISILNRIRRKLSLKLSFGIMLFLILTNSGSASSFVYFQF